MPGRGTTDAISILHQLQENDYAVNKTLYMAFVELERHSTMYPDVISDGLFTDLVLRCGWYASYRTCMIFQRQNACWLQRENSVWMWVFTKDIAWGPYYSLRLWKPSPKNFVHDVPGKTCKQMAWL